MAQIINFQAVLNERRAAAQTAASDAQRGQQQAQRPMPAYCDPTNETRGAKYDATQRLDTAEIAKRMRADIAEAIATGTLPKGIKVSVNIRRFAGGSAIDMRVRALPAGMVLHNVDWLRWNRDNPDAGYNLCPHRDCWSAEAGSALDRLKAIHSSYNRNNSDSMSDYFDVNYYGQAEFDYDLRRNAKAAEIASLPDLGEA